MVTCTCSMLAPSLRQQSSTDWLVCGATITSSLGSASSSSAAVLWTLFLAVLALLALLALLVVLVTLLALLFALLPASVAPPPCSSSPG